MAVGGARVGGSSPSLTALATAACAVALLPLHRALSRSIGTRLYPARRAALVAIADLERQVSTGRAQPEQLQQVLAAALRMPVLRIGYLLPESRDLVDATRMPLPPVRGTPIEATGERIGELLAPELAPALQREIAAASAMLAGNVRLRIGLGRTLAEVEASRARLVAAEDAARRRFERDLHDGAQQRLVSLGVGLRLAQRRIRAGADDAEEVIDAAVAEP